MSKENIITSILMIIIVIMLTLVSTVDNSKDNKYYKITGSVLESNNDKVTLMDKNNIIYTFFSKDEFNAGDMLSVSYEGKINKNKNVQDATIISHKVIKETNAMPVIWNDNGMFKEFYNKAYNKLNKMTLDEKIGQLLLVRLPDNNMIDDVRKYKVGGYTLYKKDFDNKSKEEVISMIDNLQKKSKIPLLIATDEEGGKVSRLSDNSNLVTAPFKSSSELYEEGGMELIKQDTIRKTDLLESLGININLAPVVDVSTDPESYMFDRTLKQNTSTTSLYAKTVIESSLGSKVSYTLKHFPGYGNNSDTHTSSSTDNRTYSLLFEDDIPPFKAGIKAGAEAVLMSHNIVPALDKNSPVSLSINAHNVLRNELGFTGIIMTDDLDMKAVSSLNPYVNAIKAGNDLLLVTDYKKAFNDIKKAVNNKEISKEQIDKLAFRVISWKYYKGLMYDMYK